jgi:hypothetical protein
VADAERPELTTEPEPIHPDIVIDVPLPAITAARSAHLTATASVSDPVFGLGLESESRAELAVV